MCPITKRPNRGGSGLMMAATYTGDQKMATATKTKKTKKAPAKKMSALDAAAKVLREKSHVPVILGCGLSALCSLALVLAVRGASDTEPSAPTVTVYQWLALDPGAFQSGSAAGQTAQAYSTTPPVNFSIALRVWLRGRKRW